ncbi:MAG: restriction endonuclease subunit S, partial [Clostridia bacterium]|nr:restriction endonuclease subunit S [Clostridia bacterium]
MEFYKTTLGELSIGNKGSYGIAAPAVPYSNSLYTYLRITDINDNGTLNKNSLMSVDDEKAVQYLLKPNDIVFARTGGSTGRNYFYDGADGNFVYAGFLIKFSIDYTKVNPYFIKYYCLSQKYKEWIYSVNTGSTRGNINAKTYANMPVLLPPREQQDLLVNILSVLDEKIKLNTSINENLEQQAQAIFKSWFVDFEPFGGGMPDDWTETTLGTIATISTKSMNPLKQPDLYLEHYSI